jgi:GrpB-like predicted nucleotidyltransferase (UPF0157 family)
VDRREREAYLDRVLIGGRERRTIVIADHDPEWAARFEVEARRLRHALGTTALRIEHIGSTAVPGLAAKPVIDVLVGVENPDDEATLRPRLEAAGYALRVREPGHLMFRTPARDVHVHVWRDSDPEIERHLRFRDRLRSSPADRTAYEELKRELASREWSDMNDYADAKSDLIKTILDLDPQRTEQR